MYYKPNINNYHSEMLNIPPWQCWWLGIHSGPVRSFYEMARQLEATEGPKGLNSSNYRCRSWTNCAHLYAHLYAFIFYVHIMYEYMYTWVCCFFLLCFCAPWRPEISTLIYWPGMVGESPESQGLRRAMDVFHLGGVSGWLGKLLVYVEGCFWVIIQWDNIVGMFG